MYRPGIRKGGVVKMDKKKILIIDDEVDFTKLVKMNLEETEAFQVKVENKGERGLSVAKAFKPDLILLDVMMPGIDGADVCNQLKNDPETTGIPVIFLTAIVREEDIAANRQIRGNIFIAKPVELKSLVEVIIKNIR
jgi:two-component system, OmpR family, phosphate regulon response regulator PhoB